LNQQNSEEADGKAEAKHHGERQHLRESNFDDPSRGRRKQMPRGTSHEQEKAGDCGQDK
jgi:hypothetical protein